MPEDRPPIPADLKRRVLVEAGHRCAIPTCRHPAVEIAHIVPWAQVGEHRFENLIALCPNCHTRYDKGEIDRRAMQQYKANLSVLNGRYGDLEKRILQWFADHPGAEQITLPGGYDILLMYLLQDGFLVEVPMGSRVLILGQMAYRTYQITEPGQAFITRWLTAEGIG